MRTLEWKNIKNEKMPYKRCGHKIISYRNFIYLYAGNTKKKNETMFLYEFNLKNEEWKKYDIELNDYFPKNISVFFGFTLSIYKESLIIFSGCAHEVIKK
jgi:hypothetical protein